MYICDDNPEHLELIVRYAKYFSSFSTWNLNFHTISTSPEEIIHNIEVDDEINIYLLDLDYTKTSELNGLEMGLRIREKDPFGFLIYITSHVEMSYLTFQYKVNAFDFIIKSSAETLQAKINETLKAVETRLATINEMKIKETIDVDLGQGIGSYFLDEIVAFEAAAGHKIYLYTEKQMVTINKMTLTELEEQLPISFLRCHRGYIINTNKITYIEKDLSMLRMVNQMDIPVSVRKKKKIKILIQNSEEETKSFV